MLELSIIIPFLMVPILGGVDFARFAFTRISLVNAVREGAHYGAAHSYTPVTRELWEHHIRESTQYEMGFEDESTTPVFDRAKITILPVEIMDHGIGHTALRVRAEYPFETLVAWPALPSEVTISAEAEMRFMH